uniref:putative GPI-anchored protein pfl2 n=1 Tax=Styela clava TaxID=7725 RepID=UPI001939B98C|nr:putative GPI-anchored protein pfl2 [Styela clava]
MEEKSQRNSTAGTSKNSINNPNITKTNDARAQSTPTTKVNITKGSTLTTESLSTTASSINGNTTVVTPPTSDSNLEISIRLITTSATAITHSSDTSEQSAEMKSSITNEKNQNEIAKTTTTPKLEFARNGTSNSNERNTVKNETTTIIGVEDDNSTIMTTVETTTRKIENSNSFENASQPPLATHKVETITVDSPDSKITQTQTTSATENLAKTSESSATNNLTTTANYSGDVSDYDSTDNNSAYYSAYYSDYYSGSV